MKKRKQLLTSLAVLIILGISMLILNGRSREEPSEAASETPREIYTLTDMAEDELNSLSVENNLGSFTLISGENGFTLEDEELPLNQAAAAGLAYSLRSLKSNEKLEESISAAVASDYGLDSPSALLTLKKRDGGSSIIKLGDPTPSGSGFYCMKEGDPALYILAAYLAQGLTAPSSILLDRSVPQINFQELQRLTITGSRNIDIVPYFPFEALSSSLSTLLMIKPYARPVAVNSQKFGETLELLAQNFQILDFAEDGEETGLEGDNCTGGELYLQDSSGKELTILFGENTEDGSEVYCRISGREGVVTLPAEAATLMSLTPFDLSDRFVRLIGIDSISAFSISTPSEKWEGTVRYLDEEKKEGEYSFQGSSVEADPFKKLYQEILYLLFEGETEEGDSPAGENTILPQLYGFGW